MLLSLIICLHSFAECVAASGSLGKDDGNGSDDARKQ